MALPLNDGAYLPERLVSGWLERLLQAVRTGQKTLLQAQSVQLHHTTWPIEIALSGRCADTASWCSKEQGSAG